ncbi:MAG TPA: hypothetical protein VK206_07050 [Anaerolineales bacterium]|nr:hypothetical protein [Anaerolineales bacterium]
MLPKTRQKAWIRGLPGLDKKGGFPLEALPISSPMPDKRSLSVTLYGSGELISNLQSLSKQRTKLPKFSLTVRTDPVKELDDQLQMTDAVIDSVLPLEDTNDQTVAVQLNILFSSISAKMGLAQNPGPPVNCPSIQPTGMNMGWIFRMPAEGAKSRILMEIADFSLPHYNRRLTVTLGEPSNEIKGVLQRSVPMQELILVLPDATTQHYVEFKLWNPEITIWADEKQIAFESDVIVCLTGQET